MKVELIPCINTILWSFFFVIPTMVRIVSTLWAKEMMSSNILCAVFNKSLSVGPSGVFMVVCSNKMSKTIDVIMQEPGFSGATPQAINKNTL